MQRRRSRVSNTINSMIDHFDCNYKIIKIDQKDLLSCQWQCKQKMGKIIAKIDGKWEWQKKMGMEIKEEIKYWNAEDIKMWI